MSAKSSSVIDEVDFSYDECRKLWLDVKKAYGPEYAWRMLVGWQIALDTGPRPDGGPTQDEPKAMLKIIDVEPEQSELVIQAPSGVDGPLNFHRIESSKEHRHRYGGRWFAPSGVLVFFIRKALSGHRTAGPDPVARADVPVPHEANVDTAGPDPVARADVSVPRKAKLDERGANCLARLREKQKEWNQLDVTSSDAISKEEQEIWAKLIRNIYGMRESGLLSPWERKFVGSLVPMSYQLHLVLSPKQKKCLLEIGRKILQQSSRAP
jgi:hypothetical protein